jgi:hypothetical protein
MGFRVAPDLLLAAASCHTSQDSFCSRLLSLQAGLQRGLPYGPA